jgi:hypothetical protein
MDRSKDGSLLTIGEEGWNLPARILLLLGKYIKDGVGSAFDDLKKVFE